jgi:carbamoyl-phosphate synthase large subunit
VTGLNATDNPAPGVAVLRCLRHGDGPRHRLIGMAYDALDPGVYAKDIADDVFMLPYPSSNLENFLERICDIHARVGLSVIVPTLDAELPAFIALAPRLSELGIGTLLPTREQYEARSKANLSNLARRAGLRTPETFIVSSAEELARMHFRLRYPFFIKGPYYGAKLVTCIDEALAAFHATVAQWGFPVMAQACVAGDEREERNVVALGDGRGGLLGAVAMKKLAVTDKGKGWAGVTIRDPELRVLSERFVRTRVRPGRGWRRLSHRDQPEVSGLGVPSSERWDEPTAASGCDRRWLRACPDAHRRLHGRHIVRSHFDRSGHHHLRTRADGHDRRTASLCGAGSAMKHGLSRKVVALFTAMFAAMFAEGERW